MNIEERLFDLRDEKYAAFTAKLIPTVDPSRVIGVRAPQMRQLARELKGSAEAAAFVAVLPHRYLEENGLHAALLEGLKDFDAALHEVERFLPHVDNWATCDTLSPRVFAKHKEELLPHVRRWMASKHEYTCRFGIGMLMRHYLDDAFCSEHLQWVASIHREEYYVKMMQAWYFATALAKQWDATLPVISTLPDWVRRKTILKACESFRVPQAHKDYLKSSIARCTKRFSGTLARHTFSTSSKSFSLPSIFSSMVYEVQ